MSPPHFLFACGAWHTPEIWTEVRERLSKAGFPSTAIALASVEGIVGDMTEDVAAIRSAALELADGGSDVIVVLHSYSGQPGSDAMKGLSMAERTQQGLSGGVVRLVFIMAYIVPEGFQAAKPEDAASAVPPWMQVDLQVSLVISKPMVSGLTIAAWYHLCCSRRREEDFLQRSV